MKLDILAFGAHPDDVELGCGGTLAKYIFLGKKVGIVDLTCGELGTRGNAEIRKKESEAAAKILGISIREHLQFEDGFFNNDKFHQLEIIKILRKYKPKIVFCNPLKDRHPDHSKAAHLILDSCFLSGLEKIKTHNTKNEKQNFWRPAQIFHYIQWQPLKPDFVVDISDFIKTKEKAILAYASQFYNPKIKDKKTPISTKNFLESIIYRAKDLGRLASVDFAEGFISHQVLKISNVLDL